MDMIERVARAFEPNVWASIDGDFWDGKERARESSLARARDAIAAMREPSDGMNSAAIYAYVHNCGPRVGTIWGSEVATMYRAMIDAALTTTEGR